MLFFIVVSPFSGLLFAALTWTVLRVGGRDGLGAEGFGQTEVQQFHNA
jgi:hypothetical protein